MARRELSDLFFTDDTPEVEVHIEDLSEGNMFVLVPVRRRDRERWQREHHMCPTCMGLRFLPGERRAITCPTCGGKKGPSYNDVEVRVKILAEVVHGWRGWRTRQGTEVAFTPENLARIAADVDLFGLLVSKAESLVKEVEADEGNA